MRPRLDADMVSSRMYMFLRAISQRSTCTERAGLVTEGVLLPASPSGMHCINEELPASQE
jgi:hypothetical protein